jgi:hypothetical protein
MSKKFELDFTSFNDVCRQLGIKPFYFDKVEIDYQDEHHFKLTVKTWMDKLTRWYDDQIHGSVR